MKHSSSPARAKACMCWPPTWMWCLAGSTVMAVLDGKSKTRMAADGNDPYATASATSASVLSSLEAWTLSGQRGIDA